MPRVPSEADLEPIITMFPLSHLDTWTSKFRMEHGILTDLRNVDWANINDALTMAKGRQTFVTSLAAAVIGLGRFTGAVTTTPRTVAVLNEGTVSWKTITDAGSVSAVTIPITWASARTKFASFAKKNLIMGTNGTSRPLKLVKGSIAAATRVGIDTPATAPTVASGAAGNLNGAYQWRVTYESATHENSPGPVSTKLTVVDKQVNLTAVPTSSDTQVTKRNVYRIGGSWAEWLYVGSINDNTTTTFTDNISDLNLGDPLGFDRDPPRDTIKFPVEHKQRIFAFDGNELLCSNYQEPEGWNPTNVWFVGGSSPMAALASTGSVLLAFKDTEVHGLFGSSPDDFIVMPMFRKGTIAPDSVIAADGYVYFLSDDGIWRTDGRGLELIGKEMRGLLSTLSLAVRRTAVSQYAEGKLLMSFPGQFTIEHDLTVNKWHVYPWTFDYGVNAHDDGGLGQFIITDGAASTSLRRWPGAYDDLGSAISWYLERDGASPKSERSQGFKSFFRFREVEIIAPPQSGVSVTLTLTVDGDTTNKQQILTVDLTEAPLRLGLLSKMIGKRLKVKVAGSHSAVVEIHGIIVWGWMERAY